MSEDHGDIVVESVIMICADCGEPLTPPDEGSGHGVPPRRATWGDKCARPGCGHTRSNHKNQGLEDFSGCGCLVNGCVCGSFRDPRFEEEEEAGIGTDAP